MDKGALTEKAKRAGYDNATEFARHVIANKEHYSTETIRQANLALRFAEARKKRKRKGK